MNKYSMSIIIPIFKAHNFIGRCLDSIISQSHGDFVIECILVNDFTPDDSMSIVAEKIKDCDKSIKFKIVNHTINKGASAARNSGINVAQGDFLLFVDSDDYLEEGAFQTFTEELNRIQNLVDIDVIIGNTYICKGNTVAMKTDMQKSVIVNNNNGDALRKLLSRAVIHIVCNKLIKREFLIMNKLFFEEGIVEEDLLWAYLVFSHAQSVLLVPYVTYVYCNNPQSVSNTPEYRVPQIINSRIIICEKILSRPFKGEAMIEYFVYVFYILLGAIDMFEKYKDSDANTRERLFKQRNNFLKGVWKNGYYISFLFFLTVVKPFYYLTCFRLYRRYFDRINKLTISLGHLSLLPHSVTSKITNENSLFN